jgi:hypothetical protein
MDFKGRIKKPFTEFRIFVKSTIEFIKKEIKETKTRMDSDVRERNRIYLLGLSFLFVFDYIMFSYHIDKNIFDIFPSIPALDLKKTINVYIPSEGCKEILVEKRKIDSNLRDESLIQRLFDLVAEGSYYENTAENVPVKFLIKKIWVLNDDSDGKVCVIDLNPVILEKNIVVVKGSEQMFRDALHKTVSENIPGIKKVILLEKGVPFKKLWDI